MTQKISNNIKKGVSGFRGIYPDPLSPEFVLKLSMAIGTFFKGKPIVLGTDTRLSRDVLASTVIAGLTSCGCDVHYLGVVPTPTVEVNVLKYKAGAGIIISASHNPAEWNALKIVGSDGCFLTQDKINKIISIFETGRFMFKPFDRTGRKFYKKDGVKNHIENIIQNKFSKRFINISQIKKRSFSICIDAVNGAGYKAIPEFLTEIGIKKIKVLNDDPNKKFAHIPEPTKQNLKSTLKYLHGKKFDLCFVVDPDADRLAIISDKGEYISEEFTQALAAFSYLEYKRGPIVTNLSSSMLMDYVAEEYRVPIYRSKVGEANVVEMMKAKRAVIGGEGNGGVIWPDAHYGRDSLAGMFLILDLLSRKKIKLSELIKNFPEYIIMKAKKYSETGYVDIGKIKKEFPDCGIDETDGIKLLLKNAWVHIRASATEPVVRVIAESTTQKQVKDLINKVLTLI
ncbi:MAG: phosphoglucosamine mutase [bacterium]|nr:phosphoglucosamine mutase [bacterium]